jgi:hypothetical protein
MIRITGSAAPKSGLEMASMQRDPLQTLGSHAKFDPAYDTGNLNVIYEED